MMWLEVSMYVEKDHDNVCCKLRDLVAVVKLTTLSWHILKI